MAACKAVPGSNAGGNAIDFDKMAEFDALPAPIRHALTMAPYSFNPRDVRLAWERSGMSAETYASMRMPAAIGRELRRRSPVMLREFSHGN